VKISNEFKIGLMAIVVIILSVWGYKFLRGKNLLNPTNNYFVRYDNIDQLAVTSAVLIRGMNVGTVSAVELDDDMTTIIATIDIKRGIRIPADAEEVIVSTGLMGG
jgi:phospholipid/cholesterol/gamma-HCH transport system substrate-binding protein